MKYFITGHVQPERADIRFDPIHVSAEGNIKATLSCDASQLTVVLDAPTLQDPISALVTAEDYADVAVGSLGFSLGCGYSADLIQVTSENGEPFVFGVSPPNPFAPGASLAFPDQLEVFNRALRLAAQDLFFRLAQRDYLQAIKDSTDCATYCFRAIESIKSSFALDSGVDSWDAMHQAIGTDRVSITSVVKQYADPIRHGNWVKAKPTNLAMRWEMLQLCRSILKRYLDLKQPTYPGSPPIEASLRANAGGLR